MAFFTLLNFMKSILTFIFALLLAFNAFGDYVPLTINGANGTLLNTNATIIITNNVVMNGQSISNLMATNIYGGLVWGSNYYWQKPQLHNSWQNFNDCANYAGFTPLEAGICPGVTNFSMAALTFPSSLLDNHTILVNKFTFITTNSSLRSVFSQMTREYVSANNVIVTEANTSPTYLIASTGNTTNIVIAWTTNTFSVSTNQNVLIYSYVSGTNVYTSALLRVETWTY